MVKIVQFLQLSAKFLAILRQSVSPIETLFQDFTHRLGFHMGLHFWGGLCFQGGLWSSVFVLGVFVFITTICITCNQPHIFVDNTHKSATLWFTRWALFAVKWVAIIFSLDCSKFLNCLVCFILSLIYTNIMIPYFLYPLEIWFAMYFELALSTIMRNVIV